MGFGHRLTTGRWWKFAKSLAAVLLASSLSVEAKNWTLIAAVPVPKARLATVDVLPDPTISATTCQFVSRSGRQYV